MALSSLSLGDTMLNKDDEGIATKLIQELMQQCAGLGGGLRYPCGGPRGKNVKYPASGSSGDTCYTTMAQSTTVLVIVFLPSGFFLLVAPTLTW